MKQQKYQLLCDYAIGKILLTKGQISSCIKQLLNDELSTFNFIIFLYKRNLFKKFSETIINKLFNNINSIKYAKWLLRYNFPYRRNDFIKIISKDPIISANVIFDKLSITDDEFIILMKSIINSQQALIIALSVKLTQNQQKFIIDNKETISKKLNKLEYEFSSQYFDNYIQAKNYFEYIIGDNKNVI